MLAPCMDADAAMRIDLQISRCGMWGVDSAMCTGVSGERQRDDRVLALTRNFVQRQQVSKRQQRFSSSSFKFSCFFGGRRLTEYCSQKKYIRPTALG